MGGAGNHGQTGAQAGDQTGAGAGAGTGAGSRGGGRVFYLKSLGKFVSLKTLLYLTMMLITSVGTYNDVEFGEMCGYTIDMEIPVLGVNMKKLCDDVVPHVIKQYPDLEHMSIKNVLAHIEGMLPEKPRSGRGFRVLNDIGQDAHPGSPLHATMDAFSNCVVNGRINIQCLRNPRYHRLFTEPEKETVIKTTYREIPMMANVVLDTGFAYGVVTVFRWIYTPSVGTALTVVSGEKISRMTMLLMLIYTHPYTTQTITVASSYYMWSFVKKWIAHPLSLVLEYWTDVENMGF